MLNLLNILGNFFAKHTMLYVITLLCAGSFSLNVWYGDMTYAYASDFKDLQYDIKISTLEQRQDKIIDKIYEFERRERKGIADGKDLERLKELKQAERNVIRKINRLNQEYGR